MTSSGGYRPSGTDGSDFWHRESVAWQYKVSSVNKSRIKMTIFVQIMMFLGMFVRLLPAIIAMLGLSSTFKGIRKWRVPQPRAWEFAWLISLSAVIMAWKALPKNNQTLIKQYMIGTVVFGLIPVVYGIIDQIDDLYLYVQNKRYTLKIFGYPAVLVWMAFLVIAMQVQSFGLYFSVQLLKAWRPRTDKFKAK